MIQTFVIQIWFLRFGLGHCAFTLSFFCYNHSSSNSPINTTSISFCYPTFDKPSHQLVGYMASSIELLIQGFNFFLCIWKHWVGGFESLDMAKHVSNVCCSHMFISYITFGSKPFYQESSHILKKIGILKLIINPSPIGILLINIVLWFLFLFFRHVTSTYNMEVDLN